MAAAHERIQCMDEKIRVLLAKGNVSNLKVAGGLAMCMGRMQARAQIAARESLANTCGSLEDTGPGTAGGLQTPGQMPHTSQQLCQRHQASEAEADQLYSKVDKLCKDLKSKRAELDAVLASLQGMQQPASQRHIELYSDLLLQYRDASKEHHLASRAYYKLTLPDTEFVRQATLARRQQARLARQQQRSQRQSCRGMPAPTHSGSSSGSSSRRIASGRFSKRPLCVEKTVEQIMSLRLGNK